MNKYEFAIVLNAKLEEEAKNAAVDKIKAYIERFGGTITNVDDWGKRKLAYEIKHVNEGFYYFFKVEADANAPAEIEKRLRIMEPVLRYLIIKE